MAEAEKQSWAVIGGGLLGMTLALRLRQQGQMVTLFEGADQLGGLAAPWELGDIVWDRHYHVTLLSDRHLRAILEELDLADEMEWVETRTGFYTDGQLHSMSNSLEFLKFPPLRMDDKLRLAATIFYASRLKNWKRLETITAKDWLGRLSGRRTLEKIWLPLLRAKLGANAVDASASFIWATIARMYAARRTGLKKEMFGYVRGGYARFLEKFSQRLHDEGVEIKLNTPIDSVGSNDGGLRVTFLDAESESFDRVVVTLPAPLASSICTGLSSDEISRLEGTRYQGIICASLLLKKPLSHFYVTNITEDWVPFTAVIEMTTLVDPRHLGGHSLVYLPKYVIPEDQAFALTDDQLRESFVTALERMYTHFTREDIVEFRVSRVRYVAPISTLNYSTRIPPTISSVPGLAFVNSAQIVNGTLNVNETIQLAERAVEQLLAIPIEVISPV